MVWDDCVWCSLSSSSHEHDHDGPVLRVRPHNQQQEVYFCRVCRRRHYQVSVIIKRALHVSFILSFKVVFNARQSWDIGLLLTVCPSVCPSRLSIISTRTNLRWSVVKKLTRWCGFTEQATSKPCKRRLKTFLSCKSYSIQVPTPLLPDWDTQIRSYFINIYHAYFICCICPNALVFGDVKKLRKFEGYHH